MGFSKLNIWIRNTGCEVVNRTFHLHVYNCNNSEIIPPSQTWFTNGHVEVQIPPGCYVVRAGLWNPPNNNVYTDRTIVIVGCGEEACVNLVLPRFCPSDAPVLPIDLRKQPLTMNYCVAAFLPALILNAAAAGIRRQELDGAIDTIAKVARIDRQVLLDGVRTEARLLDEQLLKADLKERDEIRKAIAVLRES